MGVVETARLDSTSSKSDLFWRERLNAGRARARQAVFREAALKEAKGRRALAEGTQTAA